MKFQSDIDIDVGDREKILSLIEHMPASMRNVNPIRKHPYKKLIKAGFMLK